MLKEQQTPSPSSSPFFLLPNPNPLVMHSLNIPSPIIHLPGINPNSFLNPKPNPDYKLNPITSLDFDPCATSRTHIIFTNTTDLTASEHAGGFFTEVPVGPMASNSPKKSGTSTPQILSDVAETKTESKNSQIIRCEICNVKCNSEKMLMEHKEGRKHLKNVEKLSVSSTIIQENEKKKEKQDLLQDAPSVESLFTCKIPDLVLQEPQSSNTVTEKVEEKVNVSQIMWCEVCKATCNSEKTLLGHNLGKTHLKKLHDSENLQSFKNVEKVGDLAEVRGQWCEVCKMDCGYNFSMHVQMRNHKKNRCKSEKMTVLPSTKGEVVNLNEESSNWCELCRICCTSDADLKVHLSGKKHQKVVGYNPGKVNGHGAERRLEDMMDVEGKFDILQMGKRKANDLLASEEVAHVKRMKVMKEEEASGSSISCRVCNVVCTKVVDFTDHLASQEHSAIVKKQVKDGLTD